MAPKALSEVNVLEGYSSGEHDLLQDFYQPCLSASTRYDRAVGFFSGALLALAPVAFAEFIEGGGVMRLVCSPRISEGDLAAMAAGQSRVEVAKARAASDLRALANHSRDTELLTRALASLVGADVLRVQIAVPEFGSGIYHDKLGIFSDDLGHVVSFVGSANETAAAWAQHMNHEQIETFCSWRSVDDRQRASRHRSHFEELWQDVRRGVRVIDFASAHQTICDAVQPEPLEDILDAVRRQVPRLRTPRDRARRSLFPHQEAALQNWRARGQHGLVAFATGGGKTRVGTRAIAEWVAESRPAVVLVPTSILLEQWFEEIKEEVPDALVLTAGGRSPKPVWKNYLTEYVSRDDDVGGRIVLATYATAATPDFLSAFEADSGHVLLVGDEVHRMGAPESQRIMDSVSAGARLGLSATPERFRDPDGTEAIHKYFGAIVEPRFALADALEAGRLTPYIYSFQFAALSDVEMEQWNAWTLRISQALAVSEGEVTPDISLMLIRRARIAKSASSKAEIAHDLLAEEYNAEDRWLIYCDSVGHLDSVQQALAHLSLPVLTYHSSSENKATVLDHFESEGGVLLAIKCLDEGVDIPVINKALILASSSNPREYIQRRGRVLRRFPGKNIAEIHDCIVTDPQGVPLMPSELNRADEMASLAINSSVRTELDLHLYTIDSLHPERFRLDMPQES